MGTNYFGFSVRTEIDIQKIIKNRGLDVNGNVQKVVDNEVLRRNADYVPFDEGALLNSGKDHTHPGSGEVVYYTPYARKQYYMPMSHDGKRCAYWFEQMKADGGKEKILEAAKKAAGAK